MTVRVRIAPSPTGDPHVGTAYMSLFNLIFARHHKGKFILRIEDTDQTRSRPEYEKHIYESLKWCGIEWDEGPDKGGEFGPYRQSERLEIYQKYAQLLLDKELAYKCFATPQELQEMREVAKKQGKRLGYDRRYRNLSPEEVQIREQKKEPFVVRLKVPLTGEVVFEDAIKGRIVTPCADIDDQVLLKSDGFPTYHLANVVDDYLMKITHIIRGDEWISSTPKHILLYEAFGFKLPEFVHMPLLLGEDGRKLSKRRNPTSIFYYRDAGYLKEAFINFLTLMGYSMKEDKEIYSLKEIIQEFDSKRIGTSGAFFDIRKLDWLNQQYMIKTIPTNHLWQRLKAWQFSDAFFEKLMPLVHTRIKTFGEMMELCDFFFINHVPLKEEYLLPRGMEKELSSMIIQTIIWQLEKSDDWSADSVSTVSKYVATLFDVNHKKIIMPILFAAVMGKQHGLPLFASSELLGKERMRYRLLKAIEFLGGLGKKKLDALKKAVEKEDCKQFHHKKIPPP
ncbi:MAG: Glutamate--tRNA ligase [Chlamydiae bacterium]|nr:Glutamate--tRNA ligase [Chlamydiota bacterium]